MQAFGDVTSDSTGHLIYTPMLDEACGREHAAALAWPSTHEEIDMKGSNLSGLQISLMLAVSEAAAASAWYQRALGATELWNLGSVIGLEIGGAAFFLGEPDQNGWETPAKLGAPSSRVEVFCDDPDAFVARALKEGASGKTDSVRGHEMPWGTHRQGSFVDPFGHKWLVGDWSPLNRFPSEA